jgi:hypothetical protein
LRATTDLLFGNKLMDVLLLVLGDKKGGFGWMTSSPIGYYILFGCFCFFMGKFVYLIFNLFSICCKNAAM